VLLGIQPIATLSQLGIIVQPIDAQRAVKPDFASYYRWRSPGGQRDRISTASRRDSIVEIAFDDCACPGALASPSGRRADGVLRVLNAAFDRFRENRIELVYAPQDLADHRFDGEDLGSKCVGVPVKAFRQ
jgi:hypothetical protein